MLYREIFRTLGVFFLYFALVFCIPLLYSLYEGEYIAAKDFIIAAMSSLALGGGLLYFGGRSSGAFYRREGIVVVVLIWFMVPAISAIPFITSGTISDPFQAYFEMVSGYTTTGSTALHAKAYNAQGNEVPIVHTIPGVLPTTYTFFGTVSPLRSSEGQVIKEGVEAVSHPLLFWRSFTQWLGGGGIIVLFVAVLPALGIGRKVLYQSEVSTQNQEGMIPTIKETAINLWKIYLFLTIAQIVMLMVTNMELPLFEAVSITFSTLATGGFSTKNQSIAGYHNIATEWVVIVFMILGSISFSLYYFLFKGKFYKLAQPEFLVFMASLVVFSGLAFLSLENDGGIRDAIFQMVSAQTTTGFVTADFNVWPYPVQLLMILAMYIGGMAGSTSGSLKIIRHIILFKSAQYRAESIFLPERVRIFKLGGREVEPNVALSVLSFFLIAVAISTFATLVYVYDGIDPETALGLTACMLNNTGMSFRMAGPEFSCAFLSDFSLMLSSFLMIFGRLEYYAVLALLIPAFWRQES
jgi:trk system potassium uptake protein TrkH